MNFNQAPGIYDSQTGKLIKALNINNVSSIDFINSAIMNTMYIPRKNFYIILSDNIKTISKSCFEGYQQLIGISGKNVTQILESAFLCCKNLEEVDFPNLENADYAALETCEKLREKYTDKNGLFVLNDKYLITINKEINEIVIPKNIEKISRNAFYDIKPVKITLPLFLTDCSMYFPSSIQEVILPLNFHRCQCFWYPEHTNIFYKSSYERFDEITSSDRLKLFTKNIIVSAYDTEELAKRLHDDNYSLKEVHRAFGKKLEFKEILDLGYSIKEANEYFKEISC